MNYKMYYFFYGCSSINTFLRFVCQLPRVDPQPKCPWHKVRLPRLGGWGVGGVNWNLLMLGLFISTWAIVPVCWHSHQVGNRRQSLKREICSCTSLSHRKLYAGFIFYKYAGFIFYKTDLMKEHMTIKICMTSIFWILILQEESPEGGRFKKEIVVDGQSYLLLIRDEGGPPELQVGSINPFW